MKLCDLSSMSTRCQDTAVQLDPLPNSGESVHHLLPSTMQNTHRTHSRSQSWSLDTHRQSRPFNYAPDISSVYSISPLTNVIREFVPSFVSMAQSSGPTSSHTDNNRHTQSRSLSNSSSSQGLRYNGVEVVADDDVIDHTNDRDGHEHSLHADSGLIMNTPYDQGLSHDLPAPESRSLLGVEISEGVRWMERNTVLIILLLFKFAYFHRYGLIFILGMFGTYFQSNQTIRKQVALKNRRQVHILILTALFLAGNIYFVYYVFWDQQIYNCLFFRAPHFTVDLINLVWSIWVTDYIIRFGIMALKALVAAFFVKLLPSNKKSKYYMLLEYISQLYRNIVPLPLWVHYLSDKNVSGIVFAVIITATYLMIKGVVIFLSLRDLYRAVVSVLKEPLYGSVCSEEELMDYGSSTCPICQEDYVKPVTLICRHIFCEDCVLRWLDRQSTCPICRATVPNHNPKWRDGSTATWPQLF